MAKVLRRFLVYVVKDVGGRSRYAKSARLCNDGDGDVKFRLRYVGPFTKTGLEQYVKYIALIANNGISASNESPESAVSELRPGECVDLDVEYVVDGRISEELDFVKLKMVKDGKLSIGGFQFDAVAEEY
ncbi:MAG: hypothetical protein RXR06_02805 [Thermoproteus sp.]